MHTYTIPLDAEKKMSDTEKRLYQRYMLRADNAFQNGNYLQSEQHLRDAHAICRQAVLKAERLREY